MTSPAVFIMMQMVNILLICAAYFLVEDASLRYCVYVLSINMIFIVNAIVQTNNEVISAVNKESINLLNKCLSRRTHE